MTLTQNILKPLICAQTEGHRQTDRRTEPIKGYNYVNQTIHLSVIGTGVMTEELRLRMSLVLQSIPLETGEDHDLV